MPNAFTIKRNAIKSKYSGAALNEQIRKGIKRTGEKGARLLAEHVTEWSDKPAFAVRTTVTSNTGIRLRVIVEGSDEAKMRWLMVDREGRAGGTIITKEDGPMRFRENYAKKTGARFGGGAAPGQQYGRWISTHRVRQGAVKPRYYSRTVRDALVDDFNREVFNGYRRARDRQI